MLERATVCIDTVVSTPAKPPMAIHPAILSFFAHEFFVVEHQ